jgi:L-amino acid N-acyltransferase
MIVRDAIEQDVPALLAIYNDVNVTSTAVYMDQPTTVEERLAWWQGRVAAGYPVLVSEDDSGITGFTSLATFGRAPAIASPWSTASTSAPISGGGASARRS